MSRTPAADALDPLAGGPLTHGLSRGRLLALGWGLAMLLPLVAAALVAVDYRQFAGHRAEHAELVVDAMERQLRDRLFLVERQLAAAAISAPVDGWVIPMARLSVSPARPADLGTLALGSPVKRDGGWAIPVALSRGGQRVSAEVDARLLTDVVTGFPLRERDFVSLLHRNGVLMARSVDHDRHIGRDMRNAGVFAPARQGLREGRYTGASVVDGVERHYYFRWLEGMPVVMMIGSEDRGPMQAWTRLAAAILAVALAIALAWGWLVRRFAHVQCRHVRLIDRLRGALRAITLAEDRLRQAHELVRLGEYEFDPSRDEAALYGATAREAGGEDGVRVPLGRLFQNVHADDRERLLRLAGEVIQTGNAVEAHYRMLGPEGRIRHMFTRAMRMLTEDGRTVVHGVRQDITDLVEARDRAERAEAEYRFLFEHNPLPMWVYDRETLEILAVNDAMVAHYGYARAALEGASMLAIRPPEDADALREAARIPSAGRPQGRIWNHLHRDGRLMRMAIFSHDIAFDGRSARLVAAQDVTEREQAEQRFQLVARATSDAVYDYDIGCSRLWWSESYFARFGYEPVDWESLDTWAERVHPADRERVSGGFRKVIQSTQSEWQEQYRYRRGDGSYATVLDRGFVLRDATGRPIRVVGGMLDISERQNYEDQLAYRATHDELTGLPNRQLLQDRLQQALLNAQRYGREGALIFIDLDDFKLVNDSLGHTAGDRVLREVASRLKTLARETDTVARFGGDEFVVVLTEQSGEQGVLDVIGRITRALATPMAVGDTQHTLTASIGWCRFPEAGADVETLLMHGDLAMYQAKREGRNRAVAFHNDFVDGISRRLLLVGQLRQALERDEFVPVFQPLFDRHERPVALETLLRWQHPERGLLLPGEFISVCEESGLIVEVGRKVLHQAARHYRRLADAGLGHLRIAVNVSPAQFNDELVHHVREAMEAHRVPADVLELEITEGLLMSHPERAIELMRQITALGVTFSVDDFGTGYSSLAYLKRFPIDRLKIDRSFVRDLGVDDDDAAICNSIIGLAHALDIRTVAEGVETALQLDWLRTRRIDEVQGYLLGRPMPFEDLMPLLLSAAGRDAVPVV